MDQYIVNVYLTYASDIACQVGIANGPQPVWRAVGGPVPGRFMGGLFFPKSFSGRPMGYPGMGRATRVFYLCGDYCVFTNLYLIIIYLSFDNE